MHKQKNKRELLPYITFMNQRLRSPRCSRNYNSLTSPSYTPDSPTFTHGRYWFTQELQQFHSWMCKRILGRIRETKITNTELNWLYSALIARQPIDPTRLMINRWCCEQHRNREILVQGVTSPCWLSL
jgi:hypothetical protein